MFKTRTSGWLAMIQSRPESTCALELKRLLRSRTLTATIVTPGATPGDDTSPREAMMPVTFVPWPWSSAAAPGPLCDVCWFGQHPPPLPSKQKHRSTAEAADEIGRENV